MNDKIAFPKGFVPFKTCLLLTKKFQIDKPSQKTSPSAVVATLVNTVSFLHDFKASGFVFIEVPGATPKNPNSGLIALRRPE